MFFDNAFKAIALLKLNGHEAKVAGGAVRDYLSGLTPKDVDIATTATPEEVFTIFRKKYHVIPTGLKHGTVTVVINDEPLEITTLRDDVETDGRHASVAFHNDWVKDSNRRDFTINSMFMNDDYTSLDPNNGAEDLENRILRFVGDPNKRIQEDYLRILRLFRFKARTKFDIPNADLEAVVSNVHGLAKISKERIFAEIKKIVESKDLMCFSMMNATGVSKQVFGKDLGFDFKGQYGVIPGLYTMGIGSDWLIEHKASKAEIQLMEKIETFAFTELNHDVYKHGHKFIKMMIDIIGINITYVPETPPLAFPVTGKDLLASGLKGKEIGDKLLELERKWAASEFTMTKTQILEGF